MNACVEDLWGQAEDLKAVLNRLPPPHGLITVVQVGKLQALIADAEGHSDPWCREIALIGRNSLAKALDEADQAIREVRPAAAKASQAINEFQQLASAVILPGPVSSTDLLRLAAELANTERAVAALRNRQREDLERLAEKISQKEYVVSGKPRWLWIIRHPFGPYDPTAGIFRENESGGGPPMQGGAEQEGKALTGVVVDGVRPVDEETQEEEVSK
jgi:hypothetical protein